MSTHLLITISITFFIVASIYSAAGFGGGSSYLAILALLGLHYFDIKTLALVCNITVVSGNLVIFSKERLIKFRKDIFLCLMSIPMAFLGGLYELRIDYFFYLLGTSLLFAAVALMVSTKIQYKVRYPNLIAIAGSGILGLLAGLIGIGGGIFLSPLLNLISWDKPKKIAATASLFILLNSLAGLAGHFLRSYNANETINLWPYLAVLIAVLMGGQLGARLTTYKLRQSQVKNVTAILVFIAGLKILADHL